MTLTADQTYDQIRWEQEGVNRGIARYREAVAVSDPSSLPPGQAMLRAVVPPLLAAYQSAQEEGRDGVQGRAGVVAWAWAIQLLPPEKLAVLTASHLLRVTEGSGAQVSVLAKALGAACRLQIEMDRWIRQSLETRKEKREEDPNAKTWDALASFRTRYPNAGTREWRGWRKRVEGLETETWTIGQEVQLGAHLIHLATQACPEWFALTTERIGTKTPSMITLTPTAQETMRDLGARAELASPTRMPMIVPPLPWRYEDQKEAA